MSKSLETPEVDRRWNGRNYVKIILPDGETGFEGVVHIAKEHEQLIITLMQTNRIVIA
jgi:hypothetical protein